MFKFCFLLVNFFFFNACMLQASIPIKAPIDLSFQQLPHLSSLTPESVHSLQDELSTLHQQTVKIRGFLYCTSAGQWILAPEPNLKTCCVGASAKICQQIFLSKPEFVDAPMHAVTVQGTLVIDPIWIEGEPPQGLKLQQIYRLDSSVLVYESNSRNRYLILALSVISFFSVIYLLMRFINKK